MRIKYISVKSIPPINNFEVNDLSDVIVLAGPNGVGKTRLIQNLIYFFQEPSNYQNVKIIIEATCEKEKTDWGKNIIDTSIPSDLEVFKNSLRINRRRRNWSSSIYYVESDRTFKSYNALQPAWEYPDPEDEEVGWNTTFSPMMDRFQDTIHTILKKKESQIKSIGNKAFQLKTKMNKKVMKLDFTDPMIPFKEVFSLLLAPKQLLDISLNDQQLKYDFNGNTYSALTSLSSGEREVLNIIFDFVLRSPDDCIVFFDEPELHLHPELSYKLIQVLKTIGKNNQFIFCTHSPELITASLENSVIFISPPNGENNQAIMVDENDDTHQALKLLGQSIGIVALGKKIVLIEGKQSSLDKQVYGAILKNRFPNLVLVPTGSKDLIKSFSVLSTDVLSKSIWGVDFYMLCDHDSFNFYDTTTNTHPHFRKLNRYHLENYFLDENIWAKVFRDMEPEESNLRSPQYILDLFKSIAADLVSYTVALNVSSCLRFEYGNLDIMPKNCHSNEKDTIIGKLQNEATSEIHRITRIVDAQEIKILATAEYEKISNSLNNDDWRMYIPGKSILGVFCSKAGIALGKAKQLYLNKSFQETNSPFEEIVDIFSDFNK